MILLIVFDDYVPYVMNYDCYEGECNESATFLGCDAWALSFIYVGL